MLQPRGALVILGIDNQGVVGGLVRGAASATDHNEAVAKVWFDFAKEAIAPWSIRVETDCNVADGPTREHLHQVNALGAQFREPRWPDWIEDFGI